MMRHRVWLIRVGVGASIVVSVAGCASSGPYGVLYVTSEPEVATLWSGKNGQYLGETPATIRYTRNPWENANPIEVVIFQKEGYQTTFNVVEIDKWGADWQEANVKQNTISTRMVPIAK